MSQTNQPCALRGPKDFFRQYRHICDVLRWRDERLLSGEMFGECLQEKLRLIRSTPCRVIDVTFSKRYSAGVWLTPTTKPHPRIKTPLYGAVRAPSTPHLCGMLDAGFKSEPHQLWVVANGPSRRIRRRFSAAVRRARAFAAETFQLLGNLHAELSRKDCAQLPDAY